MNDPLSNLAGTLDRCQTGIAAILRQSAALTQRAEGLADLLGELLPELSLTACLLRGEGGVCLAIRPDRERLGPEQERLLQSQLSSLNPLGRGVRKLPAEAMPGLDVLAAAIHEDGRPRGFLAIGLPAEASAEDAARAEAVLTTAASATALRWTLEALQHERTELARFALVGQAFAGLSHDLNNALNSMMLQASVVQLRVGAELRQELAVIRQHGAQAAGLVRSLQHVVQERREKSYAVDLDSELAELLDEEADLRRRLSVGLASRRSRPIPPIHSTRSAVKQLLRLLLEGVCAATKATVKATTGEREGGAVLSLTLAGAAADLSGDDASAAAEALLWRDLDEVGRLAGQSLLRQLDGVAITERGGEDTLILRIIWRQPA